MIGFHSNSGPGPLKNYKATHPAVNVGSPLACQRNAISILDPLMVLLYSYPVIRTVFLSCISLFRIAFTHHNHDTYWNSIFNTAQQKFCNNIGQGHNLCKPKHLSLEEAKTVYSQKRPQSGATESTLNRLYLSLPRQRPNPHAQKYNLFKLEIF